MILLTGSNGFVGRHLCALLKRKGVPFVPAVRSADTGAALPGSIAVGDIDSQTSWKQVLGGIQTVVHTAAKVHVLKKAGGLPPDEYRRVNVGGTLNLARQAIESGVQRFIFISTVKVHGEDSGAVPFRYDDVPAPEDHYSISKLEAENGLRELCEQACMELVIIRPPLIYGKGVKGNFFRLAGLVRKGYPLPFGGIQNKRSLVGIDNFCSLIEKCIMHPDAAGKVLLVSDGQDVSTPDLVRLMAKYTGKPARLVSVPRGFLLFLSGLAGFGGEMKRLVGNLQVDISATREFLDWIPPLTLEQSIAGCFRAENNLPGRE